MSSQAVDIQLGGKTFTIECPSDQHEQLQQSATHLNKKMNELKPSAGTSSLEHLAILVALNMSYELLFQKPQVALTSVLPKVEEMIEKLESIAKT